jgi:transglutaminase-like putative cysteine protease
MLRVARRDWLPLLLLLTLAGLAAASVAEARWAPGNAPWLGLPLAVGLGAVLARSRLGGAMAAGYSTVMLMAGAAQAVGRVLPPAIGLVTAPGEWAWTLHLRALTLGQRVGGWAATARAGEVVHDTGLFVWALSLALWGGGVWLAWWTLRRRQALAAALPLGLALAVNTHLGGLGWAMWWLFAMGVVVLMVQTNAVRLYADWERRGLDYPVELGLDWAGAALTLALGAGLLAAAAPYAATPAGWRLTGEWVLAVQRGATDTASQLFGDVSPPVGGAGAPTANTPDLGRIGTPIERGGAAVMWVKVSDPPPVVPSFLPDAATPQHYWRSGLFATYTGSGWAPVEAVFETQGEPPTAPPPGRYVLRQDFEIVAGHGPDLFAVNQPVTASAGAAVEVLAGEASARVRGPASTYSVTSWATRVTQAELRAAPIDYPADVAARYLPVPDTLPGRVRDLAAQIVRGADNAYDRAVRLQDYLRGNYPYTLDVPPPPAGHDAVDYFLFEATGGFCSYYASAMAVMLRTQGVAARVVTGYATGEWDPGRGAYRVPASAAHAWVEVYFPGYSWVEFEPTAALTPFEHAAGFTAAVTPPVAPENAAAEQPAWGLALALGAALVLLAGWWWWVQQAGPAAVTPRARALRLYARMRQSLARAGLRGTPGLTPEEFAAGQADPLAARRPVAQALDRVTRLHERAAYSAHAITAAELGAAERAWRRARRAWPALWLR